MAKNKVRVEEIEEIVEAPVEEIEVLKKEFEYPEVRGIGKFQSISVEGGCVVYNPTGQRVSGILTATKANDIVREQNCAAHLK